jgi:osmotically-inducible protein OsmY
MRIRSILTTVVLLLIVAGAIYYFYSYRNRDISADISSVGEYTGDAATTTAVKAALALNNRVSSFDIHVETNKNEVTLTGQVPTEDDKRVAEEITRGTNGVAKVVNNLVADPGIQAARAEKQYVTDIEIKTVVLEAILNNPELKTQQIKVEVNTDEVKLSGSVRTPTQKTAAEAAARSVANVRKVDSSALIVTNAAPEPLPQSQAADSDNLLATQVETVLTRESAFSQPQKMKVRASKGVIYLTGTTDSKAEKALAGYLARSVAGAKDVINNLEVTGRK